MAIHDFQEKLAESQNQEIHQVLDRVYRGFWPESTVLRVEHDQAFAFQTSGRDIRVTLRRPRNECFSTWIFETIEEKIRTPGRSSSYNDLLIEYVSNAEFGTLGWIYTSQADWLSYVRQPDSVLDVWILPLKELQMWFTPRREAYRDQSSKTRVGHGIYTTPNKIVPLNDPAFSTFLKAHGFFHKAIPFDR